MTVESLCANQAATLIRARAFLLQEREKMNHSFDKDIAVAYGLPEAIILNHMQFWIEQNAANKVNYHDGSYWTYNTTKAYAEIFPYLSQRQIQCALKHLRDEGILKTGNYNKSAYDRTLWYAFTEKGISIMQKCKMESDELSNGFDAQVQPIPDNNTDIIPDRDNTNNNSIASESNSAQKSSSKEIENDFEEVWKIYPKKQGKEAAKKAYIKARKAGVSKLDIVTGLLRYKDFIKANRTEDRYIKHGSTWFNQKCWEDDYSIADKASSNPAPTADDYNIDDIKNFWEV